MLRCLPSFTNISRDNGGHWSPTHMCNGCTYSSREISLLGSGLCAVRRGGMRSRLATSIVALLACCASAWQVRAPHGVAVRHAATSVAAPVIMLAKKQQKPRKRKKKTKKTPLPTSYSPPPAAASPAPTASPAPMAAPPTPTNTGLTPDAPLSDRLDSVLQRAGISQTSEVIREAERSRPQSSDPLANIPKSGQELLEKFFGGGALTFGTAFLLSGLAVAIEAVAKVLGNPLPAWIDEILVQYVEPALTPSILILFFFSISLGLLKQLQLGSESTGVLYTEGEDDD